MLMDDLSKEEMLSSPKSGVNNGVSSIAML
jgi:hypothetical protein